MHDRDNMSDEIPVADALEQDRETAPVPAALDDGDLPMEANTPDWREQRQEIVGIDDDDRDEYRE
jgi:hypothetical protein